MSAPAYDPIHAAQLAQRLMQNGHHEEDFGASPPAFPVEILPAGMRAYVEAAAASMPVPPEMIAVPMLGMIGALIGNRAHLRIKSSWQEYATLYIVVVAEPGRMKSPALDKAFWPTDALQGDAKDRYDVERAAYEAEVARHKAMPAKERGEAPRAPRMRDYFTNDSTMERMAAMLEGSPGVLMFSDEIAGWIERMNQYRKGGDREHYLSIWSGKSIKVDRKGEGSVFVRRPVLGVVGGIQPDVVPRLHNESNVRDGFVERILPFLPNLPVKKFNRNTIETVRFADIVALYRAIDAGLAMRGDGEGIGVELSQGAERVFAAWADETNALAAEIGGVLGGFYTKLEAHCARFAFVLHVLHHPHDCRPMVSEETMHHAIELAEWFRRQIDLFVPMLAIGIAPSGRAAGLWSRIRGQLEKARCLDVDDGVQEFGWVSKSRLLQGLWKVTTEELTRELDTHIDLKEVEKRAIESSTKPGWEYRLKLEVQPSTSKHLNYSGDLVPWEEA